MTPIVRIVASDWDRLRSAYSDADERTLIARALKRGVVVIERSSEERVPDGVVLDARVRALRDLLARKAASVAIHRMELVTGRERASQAAERERRSYERHLELEKDIVPPLKLEAKALRREVRRLEAEARSLGLDPDVIEPAIDWPHTLAVDAYEQPKYGSVESRRKTAVEFFRKHGER